MSVRQWARLCLLAALVSAAPSGCKTAAQRRCEALATRSRACLDDSALRDSALRSLEEFCVSVISASPREADTPPSFADHLRAAFEPCLDLTDCDALTACFDAGGCGYYLTEPTDVTPEFQCIGTPH